MTDEMEKRWVCPICDQDSTNSSGPCEDCSQYKFYQEYNSPDIYLELHANHTMWKLESEHGTDDDWSTIVQAKIAEFERKTEREIYCLGRSGRHICIEDTPGNREKYDKYVKLALKLEQEAIREFNSI